MSTSPRGNQKALLALGGVALLALGVGLGLLKPQAQTSLPPPSTAHATARTEKSSPVVAELQQELQAKKLRVEELEGRVAAVMSQYESHVKDLQRQLDAATGNMENTLLEELTLQIQEKTHQLKLMQTSKEHLQDQINAASKRMASLETQLLDVPGLHNQIAERDSQVASLETEIRRLHQEALEAPSRQADLEKAQAREKRLQEMVAAKEQEIAELQKQAHLQAMKVAEGSAVQEELTREKARNSLLKQTLAENEILIAELTKGRRDHEGELEATRRKIQGLEEQAIRHAGLAAQAEAQQKLVQDLNRSRNALLEDLNSSRAQTKALLEKVNKNENLQQQLTQKEEQIRELQQELKQARRVIASFERVHKVLSVAEDEDTQTEEFLALAQEALLDTLLEKKSPHAMRP